MSRARSFSKLINKDNYATYSGSDSVTDISAVSLPQGTLNFRNKIINGNFEIWQRGNISRTFGIAKDYSADRWCRSGYQSAAHERVTVSSPVAGMTSRYAIRSSSCTTAEDAIGSRMHVDQKIESVNCYDLAEKQITLSFWIRFSSTASSLGSSFSSRVQYNTSNTDSTTFSDVGDGQICVNNISSTDLFTTWTKITKTGLVPANVQNLTARFCFNNLVSTASAGSEWFEITEVQVEEGTVPTPFEHRPYGTELALCQRYYFKTFNQSVVPAQAADSSGSLWGSSSATNISFTSTMKLPVSMRTTPNPITLYSTTNSNSNWSDQSGYQPTSAVLGAGENAISVRATDSIAAGGAHSIHITAEAEL